MTFLLALTFLLAWAIAFAAVSSDSQELIPAPPPFAANSRYAPISAETTPEDYELLDIVLVASVDGKFHALNRTSGHELWSMSSFATTTSVSAPSSLAPLVRTSHPSVDALDDLDDEDAPRQETYIIEPQSGDIYVLHSPSSPLQRFPFSMQELVDLSPFTSANKEDTRIFVGEKKTSLLLIELETGKIKATLNSECPPIFNLDEKKEESGEIDLDELEGSKPAMSAPTEVYIARTDYHISIHKMPQPGLPAPPAQELLFSTYGPNNKDNRLQAMYRRTNDDTYIQSLPNGEVIAFRPRTAEGGQPRQGENPLLWGCPLGAPIVAVFDVLRTAGSSASQHAFVLLQPRPRLQDLLPNFNSKSSLPASAYVGLVEETGSLFAMSPDKYPLVVFGGSARDKIDGKGKKGGKRRTLDPPHSGDAGDYSEVETEDDKCLRNPYDVRCLVGVRPLEEEDRYEGRRKRLLDGPKTQTPPLQQPMRGSDNPLVIEVAQGWDAPDNASGKPRLGLPERDETSGRNFWEPLVVTLVFGLVSAWFLWRKAKGKIAKAFQEAILREQRKERAEQNGDVQLLENAVEVPLEQTPSTTGSNSALPNGSVKKDTPTLPLPATPTPATPSLDTPTPLPDTATPTGLDEGDDSEGEVDGVSPTPGKRKARRGRRGKKKKPGVVGSSNSGGADDEEKEEEEKKPSSSLILTSSPKPVVQQPSLIVSDTILGFGSHGTVVYQGSLQGRAVAVKRLLQDFVTLAAREVSILQESDDHPNVIRYYYQEAHANFLYIALELCPASLADIIESPDREQWRDIAINFNPKKALKQITSGLRHLHALKLVHRDIKPQNILVSSAKGSSQSTFGAKNGKGGAYRMLISDFGLCKKLDVDQTSFLPTAHGALAAGTVGWRAPEILRGEVKLDELAGDDASMSSRGSVATVHASSGGSGSGSGSSSRPQTRLTKSVDIFALGCLFYYTLTNGGHPYGDRFEREVNIMKDAKDLTGLDRYGEEGTEAKDLITAMLDPEASKRPDTTTCLLHPFFWDPARRLNFLQDASDRFEIMCRDPKDPNLIELEKGAFNVVGNDWQSRLDKIFIENLGKFRKYEGRSVQDLLRALRNKKHHYQDLPDHVKRHVGPMPEGYLGYFTRRYPRLFLHVHAVVKNTGLHTESMFRSYFELPDP
ncbi:unnamed protein product [Cyclocybe aegerita]|uniref:non-specific serine/threonine protein kinase n=1 Tax=Cyclocybe aegerita TaxID=1973307 RepID=A0A8S0WZZ2_CYCAE|nr:unnamed protein product [Cyclocybe aegerita]